MSIYEKMADVCIRKGYITEEDRDLYIYGFDIIFYTFWSTAVLLLTGLVLRRFWDAVIIVSVFYILQSSGGGYHAKSHLKCLLAMMVGLLAGLSLRFLNDHTALLWGLAGLGIFLLLSSPLVLHPNKSFLEPKRKRHTVSSILTTLSLFVIMIILSFGNSTVFRNELLCAFSAAFFLAGVSRITGKVVYTNRQSVTKHRD